MTSLYERENPSDTAKNLLRKFSAIMTGNKVRFDNQASSIVPTFTPFDPVKNASTLKQDEGLKDSSARETASASLARKGGSERKKAKVRGRRQVGPFPYGACSPS